MTDTDPPNQEGTDEAAETPTYKSPIEQILEKIPFFGSMFGENAKSGGGGSGGFELSLEEMEELHKQFTAEANKLDEMYGDSSAAAQDLAPLAPDDASRKHYEESTRHFIKLQKAIMQQQKFATEFAEAIGRAIQTYKENEESGVSTFRSQGNRV